MRDSKAGGPIHTRSLFVLHSHAARDEALISGRLAYGLDHLSRCGLAVDWLQTPRGEGPKSIERVLSLVERAVPPFRQTLQARAQLRRADAALAMFESEGHFLAAMRRLGTPGVDRRALVIVACWLAELLPAMSERRLRLYRWAYEAVDLVVYFSSNQQPVYRDLLGVPEERLLFVPFGIDHELFSPLNSGDDPYVLAVGRDKGRDWATFFEAAGHSGLPVKVACRPRDIQGLAVPANVEVLGYIERSAYRELTGRARVVVVPTEVRAYPTGQSVLLESMAMARCCVVTDTPAQRDYVLHDVNALAVPPSEPGSLASAMLVAWHDPALRDRLGRQARKDVEEQFNAARMWHTVGDAILQLVP